SIRSTATAGTAGVTPLLNNEKIVTGKVPWRPVWKVERTASSHEVTKDKTAAAAIDGLSPGTVTVQNVLTLLIPIDQAASSKLGSCLLSALEIMISASGYVIVVCKSMRPASVSTSPT